MLWIKSRYVFWLAKGCVRFLRKVHSFKKTICNQVWHLRVTLHFLADAGNLLDCACLAAIVALKHFRRPDVEVIGDEVTVVSLLNHCCSNNSQFWRFQHPPASRAPVSLTINHTPFCLTFAFFSESEIPAVLDPTQLEISLSEGTMSLSLNAQRELCVVQKAGGVPLAVDDILKLVGMCKFPRRNTLSFDLDCYCRNFC